MMLIRVRVNCGFEYVKINGDAPNNGAGGIIYHWWNHSTASILSIPSSNGSHHRT